MTAPDREIILVGRAAGFTPAFLDTLRETFPHFVVLPSRTGTVILTVLGNDSDLTRLRAAYPAQTTEVTVCRRDTRRRVRGGQTALQWSTGLAALIAATPVRLDAEGQPLPAPTTMREALAHAWYGESVPSDDEEPEE